MWDTGLTQSRVQEENSHAPCSTVDQVCWFLSISQKWTWQLLGSHTGAASSFGSMCTWMCALELRHQPLFPTRRVSMASQIKPGSVLSGREEMKEKEAPCTWLFLSLGRAMSPWVLAHPAGLSLTVNTGNARCVPEAQPWSSTAWWGKRRSVWQGRQNHAGLGRRSGRWDILTASGTKERQ